MKTEQIKQAFKEKIFLNDYLDFNDIFSNDFETVEELEEIIQERINQEEIIYYSNAIDFLMKHDPSLKDSLEIASDFGYTPEQLNSEILATLLLQNFLSSELYELINEIEL